jgi:two-component system, OmpR family, response regulator
MRAYEDHSITYEDQAKIGIWAAKANSENVQVLIVDDNAAWRFEMIGYFQSYDMNAVSVSGGLELHRRLARPGSYLVVLDMQLARENGLELLRKTHSLFHVPIIVTGNRRSDADGVLGLENGADDYLAKPLSLRELVARTRAVLRRKKVDEAGVSQRGAPQRGYTFDGWTLDRRLRTLRDRQGEALALTKSEFSLLIAFVENPQQSLSRTVLMQAVRLNLDTYDRTIDVRVLRLRRKLERHPRPLQAIETVRGIGYTFAIDVTPF